MAREVDVDHIMILCENPEAEMNAFRASTGFPEAWPMTDFGAILTGAVWAGRMGIEFARLEGARNAPTRLAGLALSTRLEPWQLAETLRVDGIPHVPPTFISLDPDVELSWTNTLVGGVLTHEPKTLWLGRLFGGDRPLARWLAKMVEQMAAKPGGIERMNAVIKDELAFFVHYHPEATARERREAARDAFASEFPEPVTADFRVSVELDVAQNGSHRTNWERLIGSDIRLPGEWSSPSGVSLRFSPASETRLRHVRIEGLYGEVRALPPSLEEFISLS
ncbi:hypothetical protein [Maricaulis sp.]|uniref:hypothetical protein n=1 Tax=Maricaulis sp. TaxID=1486257 RepID=UPI003A8E5BB1